MTGPVEVLWEKDHDPGSFTQGLLVHSDGYLYETTGLYGESVLRKLDPATLEVLKEAKLSQQYFGEGLVIWKDRIIWLTWRSRTLFVYDLETFELKESRPFKTTTGEGWGATHNGTHLIISDGSEHLMFWDPETLEEVGRVKVHNDAGHAVHHINELEFIGGAVLANVWYKDELALIDPATGLVTGWYTLRNVLPRRKRTGGEDCLNGIAIAGGPREAFRDGAAPENVEFLITGKKWPKLFRLRLNKEVQPGGSLHDRITTNLARIHRTGRPPRIGGWQ